MGAWLITWEWVGDYDEVAERAKAENKVAAILNYRFSGERVREIAEILYVSNYSDLSVRVAYAKNKKNYPYHAQFHTLGGVSWTGRITCGYQPCLYARLVDDIRVHIDENGNQTLTWKERPIPEHLQKMLKDGRTKP